MGGRVVRLALDRLAGPRRCPIGVLGEDARPRPDEVAIGRLWIQTGSSRHRAGRRRPAAGNPSANVAGMPRACSTRTSASIRWVIGSSGLIDRASVRIRLASSLRPALYRCSSRVSAVSRGSPGCSATARRAAATAPSQSPVSHRATDSSTLRVTLFGLVDQALARQRRRLRKATQLDQRIDACRGGLLGHHRPPRRQRLVELRLRYSTNSSYMPLSLL